MAIETHFFLVFFLIIALFLLVTTASDASRVLPGENDNFEELRINNKIFVDKSNYITKLLNQNHRFIRVCRPRRFGKSNFLQMLYLFFKGNKTLFEGLAIHAEHDWQPQPVIYLDLNTMDVRTVEDFQRDLVQRIMQIGRSYGLKLNATESVMTLLDELIYELSGEGENFESVVMLVDEYDWPVRRNAELDNKVEVWEMSDFLREFFREVRKFSDKIRLLFMTCTTPLELRHFKGGLDLLKDITYDPEYSGMIGLTEEELTSNFKLHINEMINKPNETFDSVVRNLRRRYNGYCFSRKTSSPACRVYNIHSVMSSLRHKNISNFWRATGDPNYNLIGTYQKEEYRRHVGTLKFFSNCTVARNALESRIDLNEPITMVRCMVLFGYLTLRDYNEETDEFTLDFPNEEVREKFIKEVLETVPAGKLSTNEVLKKCDELKESMFKGKWENFIEQLNRMAFFAAEDENQVFLNATMAKDEYTDRIIRVFQICDIKNHYGFSFFDNDFSLAGRIDLLVEGPDENQYLFEFEYGKSAEQAMKKLVNMEKLLAFYKTFGDFKIYMTAINFSEKGGVIDEWIRVTYEEKYFDDLQSSNPKLLNAFQRIIKLKKKSELDV